MGAGLRLASLGSIGRGYRAAPPAGSARFTGTVKKVVFDLKPHQAETDEQAIHQHAQQGLAAHAVAG
jgi:hypothetical protein